MRVVPQYRPHSEQLAVLGVAPDLFRPPKEGMEEVLPQERLPPSLAGEEGSKDLPVQHSQDAFVKHMICGGSDVYRIFNQKGLNCCVKYKSQLYKL